MAECLIRETALQILHKHLQRDIFMWWCIMTIIRGSLSSKASKVCQTTLGTSLHRSLQFTTGTRNLLQQEQRLETVSVVAILWPLLPDKTWPRWSVWTVWIFHWDDITRVYRSVAAVGCPSSWLRNREWVGWSGAFTCFKNMMEADQSGSGTFSWVTRLVYTSMTQKPSRSL